MRLCVINALSFSNIPSITSYANVRVDVGTVVTNVLPITDVVSLEDESVFPVGEVDAVIL